MPEPEPDDLAPAAPLDAEGVAALLDRPDPLRPVDDLELDIPLHAIDQASWNPKTPISGIYKRGLCGSLGEFAFRDRLKVWPNPQSRGRYVTLDGNQRFAVVHEMLEDHLASHEAARRLLARYGPDDERPNLNAKDGRKLLEAAFKEVQADAAFMADCRARVASTAVPCRVLGGLTRADAELFTATFDRNQAKVDEGKLAALYERNLAAKESLGALREAARKRLEAMARPELARVDPATVALPPPTPAPAPPTAAASAAAPDSAGAPAESPAEDFGPWGPPPEPAVEVLPTPAAPGRPAEPPLVPMMFSLTSQAHAELTDGILRSTQRMVRSTRLKEAVDRFVACSTEADLSEAAVEVALTCLQRRLAVAEQDAAAAP